MAYVPKGIFFDGSTDFMLRGGNLTGIADSGLGLVSAWFRTDSATQQGRWLDAHDGTRNILQVGLDSAPRKVRVISRGTNGNFNVEYSSITTFEAVESFYHHAILSWDRASGITQLYIDDVTDSGIPTIGNTDAGFGGVTEWGFGAAAVPVGIQKVFGGMSDFYFTTEFLDLDVVANRRKFIDASGNPVFLGVTGQLPTGTTPFVYMRGEQTDQGINSGSGGSFVIQATQVPLETPGPLPDAASLLIGAGNLQAAGELQPPIATLQGVGGFQSAGTLLPFPVATLPGVGGFQAEGLSQGEIRSTQQGVGGFQAVATFIGAVSDATLPGVGGLSARGLNLNLGIPNEEALVCDPALDTSSPGSGSLPRSWNGL